MASSQRPERVIHQDYIARIRYSNALPPPPNPPKLLDIPGTGLAGGQYTSAGYASKLHREQPLNIEADAELGMPIDLIGIPGVFDGDERAISVRPNAHIHPADKQLLKPLSAFGKANATAGAVSFLRRTEYTASQGPQQFAGNTAKDGSAALRKDPKRRKPNTVDKNDPMNIIRNIVKGFDIAYPHDAYAGDDSTENVRGAAVTDAELKAWAKPKHPSNPDLELLDSYPVLPDLDAIPTNGAYFVTKFASNPLSVDTYDPRLDTAVLRPVEDPQMQAEYERKLDEWDPKSGKPQPVPKYDYDYYVPANPSAVRNLKRKFDVNDPENDDPELYTDDINDAQRGFKLERIRTYQTVNQTADPSNFYGDSVAIALHDPETDVGVVPGVRKRLSKAAYYYPIIQTTVIRPKRKVNRLAATQADEDKIDEINLTITDFGEDERRSILERQADLDPSFKAQQASAVEAAV